MIPEPVVIGPCTIYQGDCLEILPTLEAGLVNSIVSDPPYGMNWNTNSSRFSGGQHGHRTRRNPGRSDWGSIASDDQPFDPSVWLKFPKVILWGSNHYAARLPVGTTLVWIKKLDDAFATFLSDAEIAWMKGGHGVYCRRDLSMNHATGSSGRLHPTQKPIGIMEWCVGKTSGTVLDPFMGSGTTGVACIKTGRKFIGIEKEPRYFEIARKRLERAWQDKYSELPFDEPAKETQTELFGSEK